MKVDLSSFQKGNPSLDFIELRILDDEYRGHYSSQQNRWVMADVLKALCWLNDRGFTESNSKNLRIRTTDVSKRPLNDPAEFEYADFCNSVVSAINKGTQDAMRKNYFVDWARAGWIRRFDRNGLPIDEWSGSRPSSVYFVSLTADGSDFAADRDNLVDAYFKLSKGTDKLFSGLLQPMLYLVGEHGLGYIDRHEFMFFVTAIHSGTSFNRSISEVAELITRWRALTPIIRMNITKTLASELNPKGQAGSKTVKRDWGNWVNKAKQSFDLLQETIYFDLNPHHRDHNLDRLVYVAAPGATPGGSAAAVVAKKLVRSLNQKHEYFSRHKVSKLPGFELHHIVALTWAGSQHEFKLFDNWKNMIYLDAFSHAKITQNQNRNIWLTSPFPGELSLDDTRGNLVRIVNEVTCQFDPSKVTEMLDYNQQLVLNVAIPD